MPKYVYCCGSCKIVVELIHAIGVIPICPNCISGSLIRDYNQPFNQLQKGEFVKPKVGELVKKYIEENREILGEMKKEMKK